MRSHPPVLASCLRLARPRGTLARLARSLLLVLVALGIGPRPTAQAGPPTVTLRSLLEEMADRDALARWPDPVYRQLQASTYNRASVARDQTDQGASGWFADSDGVYYERKETNALTGGAEYVLLDHTGPGALTKLWTPYFYFDLNHRIGPRLRVYLDGAPAPVLDVNLIEWVTRLEWPEAAYGPRPPSQNPVQVPTPLAGFTARAGNNYLPIPFARGCKVTLDGAPFYNIVSYRAYAPGTVVESFRWTDYHAASTQARLVQTAQALNVPEDGGGGAAQATNANVGPGRGITLNLPPGPAAVRHLEIQIDPREIAARPAALRATVLTLTCDGQTTVWCPLGDFFGATDRLNPLETWTRTVRTNEGRLICRWVMPYQERATLGITNLGAAPVAVRLSARTTTWAWDDRSLLFHAGWRPDHVQAGSEFVDWNFVDIRGQGVLVGDAWTVLNRTAGWWGEGDEKIYVDDDYDLRKFPSHFGTGTEDYYGWAGGVNPTRADVFHSAFLANLQVGSTAVNGPLGFNLCTRVRSLDAIPFRERLVFDMEASPGVDQRSSSDRLMYSSVTFWYARPGGWANRGPEPAAAARPITSLEALERSRTR